MARSRRFGGTAECLLRDARRRAAGMLTGKACCRRLRQILALPRVASGARHLGLGDVKLVRLAGWVERGEQRLLFVGLRQR